MQEQWVTYDQAIVNILVAVQECRTKGFGLLINRDETAQKDFVPQAVTKYKEQNRAL